MSNFLSHHQCCHKKFPDPIDSEQDRDTYPAKKNVNHGSATHQHKTNGRSLRIRPLLFVTLFAIMFCSTGCISLTENGITFAITNLSPSDREKKSEAEISSPDQSHQQTVSKNSSSAPATTFETNLNQDHWRAMPIWPVPTAGREAFDSLQTNPVFRWEHQGFIGSPSLNQTVVRAQSPEKVVSNSTLSTNSNPSAPATQIVNAADQSENSDGSHNEFSAKTDSNTNLIAEAAVSQSDTNNQEFLSRNLPRLRTLADRDDLIGWNALILLAQFSPESLSSIHFSRLEEIALEKIEFDSESGLRIDSHLSKNDSGNLENLKEDVSTDKKSQQLMSDSMQAAAAESWCYALSKQMGDPESIFSAAGHALSTSEICQAVRAELLRGIARKIKPRRIPTLTNHFNEAELQSRKLSPITVAALDACICYAISHPQIVQMNRSKNDNSSISFNPQQLDPLEIWPTKIRKLRWHQDHQAINRFGLWLSLTQNRLAQNFLTTQLSHVDFVVQATAIQNMGLLDSELALEKLREIAKKQDRNSPCNRIDGDWKPG